MNIQLQELTQKWAQVQAENPKMRIRDAATLLGTSEAQLIALGESVQYLGGDFKKLLEGVQVLGTVMALTRNDNAVHECHGVYNNVSFEGPMGLVLDPMIDLRLFMMHWKFGFAVEEGGRKSLQFFDKSGEAIHKIYATEHTNMEAYDALVAQFATTGEEALLTTETYATPAPETPDAEVDVAGFHQGWLDLEDTHHFHGLTRKHKLSRTQALRLAPAEHVLEITPARVRTMLEGAAENAVPIMVFVSNRGCIQIFSGTVNKLLETGPWFNVLDPAFNLHLRESAIAKAYVVKKPSVDGIITSLEVFDAAGEMIIQFFGKRKPGIPELTEWRSLVADLLQPTPAV